MPHDRRPSEGTTLSPEALEHARRDIVQGLHQLLAPQSGMEVVQDTSRMLRAHAGGDANWQEAVAAELALDRSPIAPVQRTEPGALRVDSGHAVALARFTANPVALSALEHALVLLHGEIRPDVDPEHRTHRERLLAAVRTRREELLARPSLFLGELSEQIERDREAMEAHLASLKQERSAVGDLQRKLEKQKDMDPVERERKIAELGRAFRMLSEAIRPLRDLLAKQSEPIVERTADEAWAHGSDAQTAPAAATEAIDAEPVLPTGAADAATTLRAEVARVQRTPEVTQLVQFAGSVEQIADTLESEGVPFYVGVDIVSGRLEHPRFVDVAPVKDAAGWHRATLNPFALEQTAVASQDPEVLRLARRICDLLDPKRLQTRTEQTLRTLTAQLEQLGTHGASVAETRTHVAASAPNAVQLQKELSAVKAIGDELWASFPRAADREQSLRVILASKVHAVLRERGLSPELGTFVVEEGGDVTISRTAVEAFLAGPEGSSAHAVKALQRLFDRILVRRTSAEQATYRMILARHAELTGVARTTQQEAAVPMQQKVGK